MSWPTVTLDELKAPEPRSITDGPFGSNLARRHYTDSGPRVVRLQNIGDGVFIDEKAHISEEHFATLRAHEVLPGDLLVASLGEVLPRACIAPAGLGPAIVKADCIRVRLRDDVDVRWVLYALQRPSVRRWADEHRHGVGRPRLGLKTIRQIPIPLPPLAKQRRIVAILEDHLSRLESGATELLGALRRIDALRKAAFMSVLRNDGKPVALSDALEMSIGGVWGTEPGADEVDVRVIRVTELKGWGRLEPRTAAVRSVTRKQIDSRRLQDGDLLLEKSGGGPKTPVGRSGSSAHSTLLRSARTSCSCCDQTRPSSCPNFCTSTSTPSTSRAALSRCRQPRQTFAISRRPSTSRSLSTSRGSRRRTDSSSAPSEMLDDADRLTTAVDVARQRSVALRRALLAAAFSAQLPDSTTDVWEPEEMMPA